MLLGLGQCLLPLSMSLHLAVSCPMAGDHKWLSTRSLHLLALLALSLCSSMLMQPATAELNVQKAGLRVVFPPGNKLRYDMALADFGEPMYGGLMIGNLYYPSSEKSAVRPGQQQIKCFPSDCQYGCQPFNETSPPLRLPKVAGQSNIMLLERNECFFLVKAWNAQLAGANMLIIINNEGPNLTTAIMPEDADWASLPEVLPKLKISTAMISETDGMYLKNLVKLGDVTVSLNWSSIFPRQSQVEWELWTNSNDECGSMCNEQKSFIKAMGPVAKALEQQGLTKFSPHYLMWTCQAEYANSEECASKCIYNGAYCAPDPDGDIHVGYSGKDVLMMNVRQLCFFRLASLDSKPWLWWDYADFFGGNCSMQNNSYTQECAVKIFNAVGGPALQNGDGEKYWDSCINNASAGSGENVTKTTLDILEKELQSEVSHDGMEGISIVPTVRIDGVQYRGDLDRTGVLRALCSAFPSGQEPSVCNEKWVSEDECEDGGPGVLNCKISASHGDNRCINTFASYRCECGSGWLKSIDADSGAEMCEDINECLATNIPRTNPDCSCDRCACINLIGGFKCTGPMDNVCATEYDPLTDDSQHTCWHGTVKGKRTHACIDTLEDFRLAASHGKLSEGQTTYTCGCPSGCQEGSGFGQQFGCKMLCRDSECIGEGLSAYCSIWGGGGDGGGGESPGGSGVVTFLWVMLSLAATACGGYFAYQYMLKLRSEGEMRSIMSQYQPFDEKAPLL